MTMSLPTIGIVTADTIVDIRRVWDAMGEGPMAFLRACCAVDPEATFETPATHYLMMDMGATDTKVAVWQAMAEEQTLPDISPNEWGVNDVIDEVDALAAIAPGHLFLFTGSGLQTQGDKDAWLAAAMGAINIQFVPDEE